MLPGAGGGSWELDVRRLHSDPTLTELRTQYAIDEERARGLGRAVAASSTLTALHLRPCGMTGAGAVYLAQGVGESASLTTLDLSGNKIGHSEANLNFPAKGLRGALAASSTLTALHLRYCGITAAGAALLAQGMSESASLAAFGLSGNTIGDIGAKGLGGAMAGSSTLTALYLGSCEITAAGAVSLAEGVGKSASLAALYLYRNEIGDSGAKGLGTALADSSTLTMLDLGHCGITAAGALSLAEGVGKSASLATLDLNHNKIGDSGADGLGGALDASSTITSLNLGSCVITAAGAVSLAQGVGKSASHAALHLSGNDIGDSGAKELGGALVVSSRLITLHLVGCGITAAGAMRLAEGVRQSPPRRVPLALGGVDLGSLAAKLGLGDTAGGWDTRKVLAALNVQCATARRSSGADASADTSSKHGESAGSSREIPKGADDDEERAEEPAQDSAGDEAEAKASGLKWLKCDTKPTEGTRLWFVRELEQVLTHKTELTQQEWAELGITDLQMNYYVKSGDCYFQPAARDDMALTTAGPEPPVATSKLVNGTSPWREASDLASKEHTSDHVWDSPRG